MSHRSLHADDDGEYCTDAQFSNVLLAKEDLVNMCAMMKDIQNELNKLRIQELNGMEEEDLLSLINMVALTTDPCNSCIWEKKICPKKMKISCTGIEELCRLEHDFIHEWPEEMTSHGKATFLLADCNTMDKCAKLLNMIFNVRFIERVVELKALIDTQILHMHLHLSHVIEWYNMFILRYYNPLWYPPGLDIPDGQQLMMMTDEGISTDTDA